MRTWDGQRRVLQGRVGLTKMEVEGGRVFGEVETEFVKRLISPLVIMDMVSGSHHTERSSCRHFNFF